MRRTVSEYRTKGLTKTQAQLALTQNKMVLLTKEKMGHSWEMMGQLPPNEQTDRLRKSQPKLALTQKQSGAIGERKDAFFLRGDWSISSKTDCLMNQQRN